MIEIRPRRCSQALPEHGNEGARRAVAGFQGRVRDFCSFRQKPHGLHETQLLSPLAEGHARVLQGEPFNRPFVGACFPAQTRQGPAVARASGRERRIDWEAAAELSRWRAAGQG
jgi:hypothetical protein